MFSETELKRGELLKSFWNKININDHVMTAVHTSPTCCCEGRELSNNVKVIITFPDKNWLLSDCFVGKEEMYS